MNPNRPSSVELPCQVFCHGDEKDGVLCAHVPAEGTTLQTMQKDGGRDEPSASLLLPPTQFLLTMNSLQIPHVVSAAPF